MIASEHQSAVASSGSVLLTGEPPQEALFDQLGDLYQFRNRDEVEDYLRRHDCVANVLLEAPERIKSYFGRDAQVALEVITYPDDGDRKLFAFILTLPPVEQALNLRDQLDEEWWLEASERAQGQLILDVELI